LTVGSRKDSVVLDFFAGSGTTAQAVLEQNALDGGDRKFIAVQLPEPTPDGSAAREAGYDTISELAIERIKRAGSKVKETLTANHFDAGFRVLKITDTNFTKWRMTSEVGATVLEQHLLDLRESTDDDATPDSLLTEILLKQGYSLSEQISDAEIDDLRLKAVGDGLVLAYLDEHHKPTLQQLRAVLASENLAKFIMLEDAFKGDDELKTNLVQEAKTRGVELWTA
jgi:adenine-specific DNA-methyltransferase